jgi:nickel-type superoxide dismutase maturation protease
MFSFWPISRYRISGQSMLPTLKPNSSVITFNWYYHFADPKKDDLVVLMHNSRVIIKRIKEIKKNKIWLEGDNLEESTDSRTFGWVDKSKLLAKVILHLNPK